jgi:hypothetical protein
VRGRHTTTLPQKPQLNPPFGNIHQGVFLSQLIYLPTYLSCKTERPSAAKQRESERERERERERQRERERERQRKSRESKHHGLVQ